MRAVARRLFHGVFLLAGVSLLTFSFQALAPGDFLEEMRVNPQISSDAVRTLRERYGLDRPLPVRYLRWALAATRGDFGFSFAYNRPVASLLWPRARNTLLLASTATAVSWLLAIPLGVWSASRRGSWSDRLVAAGNSVLLALPDVLIVLLLLFLAVRTGALPTGGMVSADFGDRRAVGRAWDVLRHLLLPAGAIVLSTFPLLFRHVRGSVIEALGSPALVAARGLGIRRRTLLFRYALRAAANPLVSLFGVSLGTLLGVSLLIEVVTSWPGLGPLLLESILSRDVSVVVGAVLLSTVFLVAGRFCSDLLLRRLDPRVQQGQP